MNIKKTKLALALSGALFLMLPISQTLAHESHCEIEDTELGDLMKYMKSELRGYVKGFKSENQEKMQQHLDELLKLSKKAQQLMPVTISNMDMKAMESMDHSKMDMKDMDHSKMNMEEMDHSNMDSADHDMSAMPSMEGMSAEQHHQHLKYMQGMEELQALFKTLNETKGEAQIKTVLREIGELQKKSHQKFRQDCS